MKMTCLMRQLGTPALDGIGLSSSSRAGSATYQLFRRTRSVIAPSCASVGAAITLMVPNVLCLGDPRLSGGVALSGPAPRPFAFATMSVLPSFVTWTLLGHQPTGM